MESSPSMGLFRYSISHPLLPPYILRHASFWQQGWNVESAGAGEGEQVCAGRRRAAQCGWLSQVWVGWAGEGYARPFCFAVEGTCTKSMEFCILVCHSSCFHLAATFFFSWSGCQEPRELIIDQPSRGGFLHPERTWTAGWRVCGFPQCAAGAVTEGDHRNLHSQNSC